MFLAKQSSIYKHDASMFCYFFKKLPYMRKAVSKITPGL